MENGLSCEASVCQFPLTMSIIELLVVSFGEISFQNNYIIQLLAQESRQYLIWDREGEENTTDEVASSLFEAAEKGGDEEGRGRGRSRTKKDKKVSKGTKTGKDKRKLKKDKKNKKKKKSSSSSCSGSSKPSSSSSSSSAGKSESSKSAEVQARLSFLSCFGHIMY